MDVLVILLFNFSLEILQLEEILELFNFNWIFEFQFVTFIYTIVYS